MPGKYQDNLAYDLSMFEERKPVPVKEKEEENARVRQPRAKNGIKLLKILAAVTVCGFLAGALLYSNATLAELDSEAISLQKELDSLRDDELRMNLEIDNRVCTQDIDEYITKELGMVKVEKYQVNYIDLSEGDEMDIAEKNDGLWDSICAFFSDVKEYFS